MDNGGTRKKTITNQTGETQMKCPSCNAETNTVVKEEYIWPEWFLGIPAFWPFMSPTLARATTALILGLCIILTVLTIILFSEAPWFIGLLTGLLALLSLYFLVFSVKSLGQHQIKKYYKCGACGLEWSPLEENGQ
jgi:hypothetical protein